MGYIIKQNIANVSIEPKQVTLTSNPNYIEFESINKPGGKKVDIKLNIVGNGYIENTELKLIARFSLVFSDGNRFQFTGSNNPDDINRYTFFTDDDLVKCAESLCQCFFRNEYLMTNYDISILLDDNEAVQPIIHIVSKGSGQGYAFQLVPDEDIEESFNSFMEIEGDPSDTNSDDSIDEGTGEASIELKIYNNTGIFLGESDEPSNNLGDSLTIVSKSYGGMPLWFDLSTISKSKEVYSNEFLNTNNWVDAGTMQDLRFTAIRIIESKNKYEIDTFYFSNVLYFLTGYTRNLNENDLSAYVYDAQTNNIVKPLTKQPVLFHVKGQTQYFNFILKDSLHNSALYNDEISILYKLYTQSKSFITSVDNHKQYMRYFNMVNTIKLDLDNLLYQYDNVGTIEVYLSRNGIEISEPLLFKILPECLYKVNDFAFLNSLGGWSSFSFGGTETIDFKSSANTIFKPQIPRFTISDDIESVLNKEINQQFTVQTMPLKLNVCEWLKELSSSIAVYELKTKRYVIVDEMNIKPNSKDELFRIEMKYHYSDKYNAFIE